MSFGRMSLMKFHALILILSFIKFNDCLNLNLNEARYDNYRAYLVFLETEEHLKLFQDIENKSDSYIFLIRPLKLDQRIGFLVAPHKIPELEDVLERYKLKSILLIKNLQENIDKERETIMPDGTPGHLMDWENYFHLFTIYDWMESLTRKFNYVRTFEMGRSYEGFPIKGIQISTNSRNSEVFIEAGIHPNEIIGPSVATFIIQNLLFSNLTENQNLRNNFNWFIVPVINPDGYKFCLEKDRLWRKNMKPYGRHRGVDLNRNFDIEFGGIGSSSEPDSRDFSGSHPFSEPESNALARFLSQRRNLKTFISLHSYSQLLMFPFGFTREKIWNYDHLMQIGEKASESIFETHGKKYKFGARIDTIYPTSGGVADWSTLVGVPIPITIELRPSQENINSFMLPADEIIPTGEETMAALITILNEAQKLGYYD